MKAIDIRIGNLVGIEETALHADGCNHLEAIFEIEELKKEVAQFKGYHTGEYYKDLKGVPITEERLKEFGFENNTICLDDECAIHLEVVLDMDDEKERAFCYIDDTPIRTLNYWHELQNLYFALKGEELKSKKPVKQTK